MNNFRLLNLQYYLFNINNTGNLSTIASKFCFVKVFIVLKLKIRRFFENV